MRSILFHWDRTSEKKSFPLQNETGLWADLGFVSGSSWFVKWTSKKF